MRTLVKGVTDFAIVTGPTAAYVGWHYWNEAHNGQAQNRAKELYCAAHPGDTVCTPFTGGQCEGVGYEYGWEAEFVSSDGQSYGYSGSTAGQLYWSYAVWGQIKGIRVVGNNTIEVLARGPYYRYPTPDLVWVTGYSTGNTTTLRNVRFINIVRWDRSADNCGNPPPLPWKDWPQAKRDAAVALLNNSDWQRLITSMPFSGTLDPGNTAKAPTIVIPGQEWDNPNTPLDDRRLKTVPGEYARPVVPDFDHDGDPDETDADDDNDGVIEPYDPEPRNPYLPRASSDSPPPPDDDTPPQSEGEKAVSKVRQSYGDFLEKAENDTFENRLDAIEGKYKQAAAMEDEAAVDPNVGFEQQRLIDEADSELQQLKDEIQQVWWSSLSQAEQQLFGSINSADIDETRSHMEQWSPGTFGQYAQTYEEGIARNILHHADDKGYSDPLKYLRDASNFDTAKADRTPRNSSEFRPGDDTAVWRNPNTGEYIVVDKEGKIRTYGKNLVE